MQPDLKIEFFETSWNNEPAIKGNLMEGNMVVGSYTARTEREVRAYLMELAKQSRTPYKSELINPYEDL